MSVGSDVNLKPGTDVHVFYRMSKRCTPQRKYFAVLDPRQGSYRPRTGLSDGWVPAKVISTKSDSVEVEYTWPHFATCRGHFAERDSGWTDWYSPKEVRLSPAGQVGKLNPAGLDIKLALLTFRWGGYNQVIAPEQWGDTGSSVSDVFIDSFIDRAIQPTLGNDFEVWTVYVEDKTDMEKLASSAHLIFGPTHPSRRAEYVGGMYHLYPTSFEEGCIPSQETGSDGGAALVDQKSFFKLQQAVERTGIPTRFPHPSGFYELLASKRWTYMMSLTPHLRVPPTISVPRMLCEKSIKEAASNAIASLTRVKKQQALLRGEPEPKEPVSKGVAKLGFSWEALDVKFWDGQGGSKGLETALFNLTQNIEISQELTGQPHDLEAIIVQEYCKHDLEIRLYVVDGIVQATIYTKFCKIKDNLEFGDFHELFEQEKAASAWCGGDLGALQDGERQCRAIVEHWMVWVQAQLCEVPPAIRFDFFMGRGEKPGSAVVWTLEICELGFSMLGEKELPNKVFKAMLGKCLGGGKTGSSDPACLPNSGPRVPPPTTPVPAPPAGAVSSTAEVVPPPAKVVTPPPPESLPPPKPADADVGVIIPAEESSDVPNIIHISVPAGPGVTQDQALCTGKYERMGNERANGAPVWTNDRADRFLYHGNDDNWYVGDEEEMDLGFDCDQGYIRHESAGGMMPHLLEGDWERGEEWIEDPAITVNLDGTTKPATARNAPSTKGAKGKSKRRK